MPKREPHTQRDIAELAEYFQPTWRDGQVLRTWLKSHAAELRELVREQGWSWANLGHALTQAGITYQTGAPWSGENLRRNLSRAETPGKREIKLQRLAVRLSEPERDPEAPMPTSPGRLARLAAGIDPRPPAEEFQLIRRTDTESRNVPPGIARLQSKQVRPVLSEAEIDAIVMGRSARR